MIHATSSMLDVAGAVASVLRELHYNPVVVGGSAAIIAGDVISDFVSLRTSFGEVRVLQPVDVVNDRLNKYVAYEDPDSFDVAVMVARIKRVDLERVKAFIERQAVGAFADSYVEAFVRLRNRLGLERREFSQVGFTTAFRVRFHSKPTIETAQDIARGVQALLDEERAEIDPILDGVTVDRTPTVRIHDEEPTVVTMTIEVGVKRDLAPVDRFALAKAIVDHLREKLSSLPELAEIPDDGTPPVATVGL